ncbi:MAG: cell surface protein SprA, partial [Bacteroidota bacterium]
YEPYYQNEPAIVDPNIQIVEEEVWITRQGSIPDPNERLAVAYINLPSYGSGYGETLRDTVENPGQIETGPFIKLDRSQYELSGDGYIGVLSLNVSVGDQQIVAIAYRRADGTQFGELVRDVGTDSLALSKKIILKMVKPKNLVSNGPSYQVAWKMLLKNIYPIPGIGRNLKKEGFSLDIVRVVPGAEDQNSVLNEPLLRVLGVDRFNTDDTPAPDGDGEFDFRPNRTISQARAEIIFPTLRPFDDGIQGYLLDRGTVVEDTSEYLYQDIYDTTQTFAQQSLRNRYVIRGKATGEATSRYSLGFNVVEGSVRVLLDGGPLIQNIDFTVDYIIGEVVIKNDRALVPGANLQITYEQNDLFQLASKTLLGARGDLAISSRSHLGFTVMNLNQETLSDKVRLGEEPNNNTIFGVDGSTSFDLPLLTTALNALPLLQTRENSEMKISGEAAYMLPDPNTRKSTIPSDGGEGIAYIDDFEGARRGIPVGIAYTIWHQATPPAGEYWFPSTPETTKTFSKGKMIWFNRLPTDVRLTDVYPRKFPGNEANNQITVLDLQYFPTTRGQFNYSVDLENTLTPNRNWGGVMKPLSLSALNLTKENVNFIEIWMQINAAPQDASGKMVIDLGSVSEDVIPNRILNSEDLVLSTTPNGTLQDGEDIGIDMLGTFQEQAIYTDLIQRYPDIAADPSGDDYSYNNASLTEDFLRINGSEGNKNGPAGRIPDTEDLNSNGVVDLANSYFQYELSLDTVRENNPYIAGGGNLGWYQFRIPIQDYIRLVGSPTQENIEYVRVSFINVTDTIAVRVADFSLVGNQWQKQEKDDTTYEVSVVNIEDNPFYESPPGVIRERDRTRPDENVLANEQSLALVMKGVPDGESRQAVRFYTFRALDLFNYKTMKMFVWGDDDFQYVDENNYDAEMFFRFGLDSLNYYEYRSPVRSGWNALNEIIIKFDDLTAIKQARDSVNQPIPPKPVEGGPPGATYNVLGNPSLTRIVYLALGVENPQGKGTSIPLEGQVWFNELRLVSVDDTPGWAYRVESQVKLADLGAVSFNYSKVDPNFHRLEDRFGSRNMQTSWSLSASGQLERFFPSSWAGTSLPISYTHSESMLEPKYLPNSDVLVDQAAEQARERVLDSGGTAAAADSVAEDIVFSSVTRRVSETYAAPTFRIVLPTQWWLIRDTFNRLTFGATYNKSSDRSPALVYRKAWAWTGRISYSINLSPDYHIKPFAWLFGGIWLLDEYKDFKINFVPSSFNWQLSAARSRNNSLQRTAGAREIVSRNFTTQRGFGFNWKFLEESPLDISNDYNLAIAASLLSFETDSTGAQRPFSDIMNDIFGGDKGINFGEDTRYSQRNQFTFKPKIPNIFGIRKYLDLNFTYGSTYNWLNTLIRGDLGKSSQFSGTFNATMNLKLKQMFDPLFSDSPGSGAPPPSRGRRGRQDGTGQDGSTEEADSTDGDSGGGIFAPVKMLLNVLIKIPFLDYDNINVSFSQTNSAQNSGVIGGTGFLNYWGRVPFSGSDPQNGPSRLYQLGLISDPSGKLTNFRWTDTFPFFKWDLQPGPRAPGGNLLNVYRQTNRLTFKTSRGLWEGARIDLNWKLGWSYNRTQNLVTDSLVGIPTITNTTTTGAIDRSFLTFPDFFIFGMFNTGLEQVGKLYGEMKSDVEDTRSDEQKLVQAFEEGMEAIPWLRQIFGQYYPRVNWNFRWDGLEKIPLFANFVSRLSLDHSYNSAYTRQYQNRPGGGGERTDAQRVTYGFTPLIGLNFTFKDFLKGNFGANLRFNSNTSYDLANSSRNIVESFSQEMSITASYSRKGFEIPLFGLSLSNDVDVSFSYSVQQTSRKTYDVSRLDVDVTGRPLEGQTRTAMEPRIRYVLSSRVTASVYYRYQRIAPDDAGSRIPGTTTNEAGLDIQIAIR